MTHKQIEAAKAALPHFMRKITPEQYREHKKLWCREMINSCLVYGEARYSFYDPETGRFGQYARDYVKELGEETVIRIYNEQVQDFSKAIVKHCVGTDGEGVTYNACIWADEQ